MSITNLEFRRAGQSGIPRIALLRISIPDVSFSDLENPQRIALVSAFRTEVASEVRAAEFRDLQGLIQGLSTGIQVELDKRDRRQDARGARQASAADTSPGLARIAHQRREDEHRQAMQTFEELARLLDRRLYRMRRWYWAIKRRLEDGAGLDQISAARKDYDEVLLVWNDNLNRMLALVDISFGRDVRRQLETGVFEEFAAVGRALEEFARQASGDREDVEIPPLGRKMNMLRHRVYRLNSQMLSLMRDGHVGQDAPRAVASAAPSGLPQLEFGHNGSAVRRLQRALGRSGESPGLIDGGFGRNTDRALRAFQRSHDLDHDGIAGPRTWDALPSGAPMPVLREGARGELVRELQAVLAEYAEQRWEAAPGHLQS